MFLILLSFGLLNLYLFITSTYQNRHSHQKVKLIYWAIPLGAFTWEDLLVVSFFHFLATVVVLWIRDVKIILLYFLVFWIVRNFGEMIYWFLQQFHQPTMYPHNQYQDMRVIDKITGKISLQQKFIIMQVLHESLLIFFLSALIYLLANWTRIQNWF